jgi:hypothetical protein
VSELSDKELARRRALIPDPSMSNDEGYTAYGRTPKNHSDLVRLLRNHRADVE